MVRQGWLDITYLSPDGSFRISKGNKGTTFVLVRDEPPRQLLMSALDSKASDDKIMRLAEDVVASKAGESAPARSAALQGGWKLRWAAQVMSHHMRVLSYAEPVPSQPYIWQIFT